MLNFDFSEKDLAIVLPPDFVYDFARKIFLMLYSTNEILLSNCLYFLRYWEGCALHLLINQVL